MSYKFKGILSFPVITANALANKKKADPGAKYGLTLIFLPGDAQIEEIKRIVDTEIADGYPNGMPGAAKVCFSLYDERYKDKDYYDPRFAGSYVLSCSAPEGSFSPQQHVIDSNMQPIMDPAQVYAGAVAWVNVGISKYSKGTGGIGCWLNGVLITDEEPPMGRLDNKPTVEQMFSSVAATPTTPRAVTPPPAPATPPLAPSLVMTPKANGATYDQFISRGWTDTMLIEQGYATKSVTPSFA